MDKYLEVKRIFKLHGDNKKAIPYEGAKSIYLVKDVDNQDTLANIVLDIYEGLK